MSYDASKTSMLSFLEWNVNILTNLLTFKMSSRSPKPNNLAYPTHTFANSERIHQLVPERVPSKHTTSQERRCNVVTLQRRCNDVLAFLLGTDKAALIKFDIVTLLMTLEMKSRSLKLDHFVCSPSGSYVRVPTFSEHVCLNRTEQKFVEKFPLERFRAEVHHQYSHPDLLCIKECLQCLKCYFSFDA